MFMVTITTLLFLINRCEKETLAPDQLKDIRLEYLYGTIAFYENYDDGISTEIEVRIINESSKTTFSDLRIVKGDLFWALNDSYIGTISFDGNEGYSASLKPGDVDTITVYKDAHRESIEKITPLKRYPCTGGSQDNQPLDNQVYYTLFLQSSEVDGEILLDTWNITFECFEDLE
ncbi:MAG: hypothetical protein GF372_03920 [Candidatus Marinimicrobia bacterium]|nr:hypothetical protein [Candidatus Neomarinimicrobiota bacterium]